MANTHFDSVPIRITELAALRERVKELEATLVTSAEDAQVSWDQARQYEAENKRLNAEAEAFCEKEVGWFAELRKTQHALADAKNDRDATARLNGNLLAELAKAQQPSESAEPVAIIKRNEAGQVFAVDNAGRPFDISKHVGKAFYAAPPSVAAAVQAAIERCIQAVEDAGGDNEQYHADAIRALSAPALAEEAEQMRVDAARWRYWRSVWFDMGVNYRPYRSITNAGDIETVEREIDAACSKEALSGPPEDCYPQEYDCDIITGVRPREK